ncbi:MAG: 4Fe-4S binding protein, partial [Planctomycetota bacterium]|nr:4Fe-4S binding protein [Planctomycetota bacterium]
VWCTVCPMELLTSLAARIGLRRKVPRFMKSGWVITIFYVLVVLVGLHALAIHRVPHRMAMYMLILLVAAAVIGLVFEKRAFCSYVCPVGHLLGLYAQCSVLEWRVADESVCDECKTKDCVAKKKWYNLFGHSCAINLYPPKIATNRDCLLCTHCLKVCPNDNLRLSVRRPFADFFRPLRLTAAQVGFVMIVSGFVVYEVLSEWAPSKEVVKWAPNEVVAALGLTGPAAGFAGAVVMFVVFPAVMFLVVTILATLIGRTPPAESAKAFALMLVPIMACAHFTKAIFKMTSRLPYWHLTLADPKGVETANRIVAGTLTVDKSLPASLQPVTTLLATAAFATALVVILVMFRRQASVARLPMGPRAVLLAGALAYWAVFAVTICLWRL